MGLYPFFPNHVMPASPIFRSVVAGSMQQSDRPALELTLFLQTAHLCPEAMCL